MSVVKRFKLTQFSLKNKPISQVYVIATIYYNISACSTINMFILL
jgi:hypothetical protein